MLANRLTEIIGLTILHSLWQITLLWIVLVAVLRLWPKASSAVRYAFAISILVLSVLTTAATAVYEWQLHAPSETIAALPNGSSQTLEVLYIPATQTILTRITDAMNASVPVLAWLWCAGLVVMGTRFGGSFSYLRTLRAQENIAAVPPVWKQELKRLSGALGLRCDVAIAASARISSPIALGSISPIILVPVGLLSGMSAAQIEAILVHELYHIKRRDYFINICQALVEVLLFYHPAIWHINNIIRQERENCCDDQTVAYCGDAIAYARALTQIQEIKSFAKPTLAMSATGPNAGNFTNRIKRLFHIYPDPAQARSKGILAIGFLLVYLGIVLASANISTARPVEPEENPVKINVNDHNTFSNILSDSITGTSDLRVPDEKKVPHRPVADGNTRSINIPRTDTTVSERSLGECLQQVNLVLKMASLYLRPHDSLGFSRFSVAASLQVVASADYLSKASPQLQPTRFYGNANLSRMTRLNTNNGTTTNEPIRLKIQDIRPLYIIDGVRINRAQGESMLKNLRGASVSSISVYKGQQAIDLYGEEGKDGVIVISLKRGTAQEILIPRFGISEGSVRIFAGGTQLKEGTDYSADYVSGKVTIMNERILNSGKNISVQYEQADPFAFQKRNQIRSDVDYDMNKASNVVQVFPNATNGILNISFTPARNNSRVKIVLVDSDGTAIKEVTNSIYDSIPTELHVDVSGYRKGLYVLQISIDGATSQQRVVVE